MSLHGLESREGNSFFLSECLCKKCIARICYHLPGRSNLPIKSGTYVISGEEKLDSHPGLLACEGSPSGLTGQERSKNWERGPRPRFQFSPSLLVQSHQPMKGSACWIHSLALSMIEQAKGGHGQPFPKPRITPLPHPRKTCVFLK